ncbi:MAG: NCS2 family permease [Treponema sp.]|nr:NCS2 family permease [Treponema sp.]
MEKVFKLKEHGTTFQREIVAGLTTFLTMAYILAVNPGMLSGRFGGVEELIGMPWGGIFTATALSAAIATMVMAFAANLPIALAPGMGLNAFFVYNVVQGMGYSWEVALTAVFLEGILFVALSLLNVREAIINAIPVNLKKAVAVGIGLFIALIGFANAGIIVQGAGTVVRLAEKLNVADPITGSHPLLAFFGLIIIAVLYVLKIPGSILIGIIITTVIGIPMGVTVIHSGWSPFRMPDAPLLFRFDFSQIMSFNFFVIFFTFLFVDIFDTIGTLVGVTTQANLVDKNGNIPRVKQALLADSVGTVAGAALGTSTVTSYVESAAGVAAGGRTGLTSLTTAVLFLIALFLSPLFGLIPNAATAPALIFVGFLMIRPVVSINFEDPTEGIPAFITIIMMPFAYSIADGIVFGIISYVIMKVASAKYKDISVITWILFVIFLLRFFTRQG